MKVPPMLPVDGFRVMALRPRRRRLLNLALFTAAPAAAFAALAMGSAVSPPLLLINETRSVPPGLYLREPRRRPALGAVVAARQPPQARRDLAGLGVDPEMALLKRVAGLPGQVVCSDGRYVVTPLGLRAVSPHRLGGPAAWQGCGALGSQEIFLLGDSAWSYDSRYFGPAPSTDLLGVYRPVLTW